MQRAGLGYLGKSEGKGEGDFKEVDWNFLTSNPIISQQQQESCVSKNEGAIKG